MMHVFRHGRMRMCVCVYLSIFMWVSDRPSCISFGYFRGCNADSLPTTIVTQEPLEYHADKTRKVSSRP